MKTVIGRIYFLSIEEGGRLEFVADWLPFLGCPVIFKRIPELSRHGYDCRLYFDKSPEPLVPGVLMESVSMAFSLAEEVLRYIHVGTEFSLWKGEIFGHGEIVDILS